MATQLFLLETVADTHLGTDNVTLRSANQGWYPAALGTSRGSGVVASQDVPTLAGPTPGREIWRPLPATEGEWISPPVAADVTISGTITANIWCSESSMSANVAINVVIEIIRANATATRNSNTLVEIVRSTRITEEALTTRAAANFTTGMTSGAYTGQTLNRGDRLRIRVFADDAGTMASGFTFNASWNGTSAAADGDSYVTFTETFSFESAPSGSVLYLTNVQSGLTAAPALISAFAATENPLSEGGNWANLNTAATPLKSLTGGAKGSTFAGNNRSYWTPTNFGPDLEAYVSLVSVIAEQGIMGRIQGEGGSNTWDGYTVLADQAGSLAKIQVVTNGTATDLISVSQTWASAQKLGLRIEGSTIQLWRFASSTWNLVATAVDTTYPSAGKIGLYAYGDSGSLDDFYAATDSNLFTQQAWTSRGAGVVSYRSDTDAGWVAPLLTNEWFTPQLSAFTLTGMARANIRALESSTSANASLRCEIARVESDGSSPTVWSSWCCAPTGTDNGELSTSEVARTINLSGDDLAISDGQRLRIRLYNEDSAAVSMGNGFNVQRFYNGTSGGASGDSYITLAQTVTEFSAGGTTYTKAGYGKESG